MFAAAGGAVFAHNRTVFDRIYYASTAAKPVPHLAWVDICMHNTVRSDSAQLLTAPSPCVPCRPAPTSDSSRTMTTQIAFDPRATPILHVALEYALPQFGLGSQLMYGGMGQVVSTFLQHWPGPMALVAPMYKPCYSDDDSLVR